MVFYRKYRPQKIDDLDSESVRETLISVLSQNTPHAFLFTGPKGLGKTSTARIIAKSINCTERQKREEEGGKKKNINTNVEPCGKCDSCLSITNGTNMDILEIDAASNRGIDEIRDLKEKIRLAPLSARKKVYIIDEVHMLTTEAFNALLKTLEEPPEHAMFILATTEPQKVPPTILSRCFHISFKKATEGELVRSFKRIAKGEGVKIDEDALVYIASLSDGSFRDGVKILEEMSLLAHSDASGQAGKPITKKFIQDSYNFESIDSSIQAFIKSLALKDAKEALVIIKSQVTNGTDIKYFLTQIISELHNMLLAKIGIGVDKKEILLDVNEIRELINLLTRAHEELKYAVLPQLPLEMAVIEYTHKNTPSNKESTAQVTGEELIVSAEEDDSISVSSLRKQAGNIKKIKALYGSAPSTGSGQGKQPSEELKETVPNNAGSSLMHTEKNGEITKEWMDIFWKSIITEMKKYNHTVTGLLRGCVVKSYDKKSLVIETDYKFHKEKLSDPGTKLELERICKMLTGKDVSVAVELKEKSNKK